MSQIVSSLFVLFLATSALAFDMGVNIHQGGGSLSANQQIADLMKNRNLKTARLDYMPDMDLAVFRDQVQKIRAQGGRAEISLQIPFQWDHSCNQNFAAVDQKAYSDTILLLDPIKDIVWDIELLNEVQLRPEILQEVPYNSAGGSIEPYVGKPCVATLTAALKGMSRAISDLRTSSGLPLRTILGVVGRDFGFMKYMIQQGVQFDITGYHVYPMYTWESLITDPWYGPGGAFTQLAQFNRPVHLNEFHCNEIYNESFENQAGGYWTEQCFKALDKHLTDLKNQTIANIESVHIYELIDEPTKPAPESHFGMMYNLSSPKVNLLIVTAFAGGNLTAAEQAEVTSRGLLTDAEIANFKATGGGTPVTLPDVIVTSISMNPQNPIAGQAVTFSAVVKNIGTASTPEGIVLGVGFLVDGAVVNWSSTATSSLAPGATVTLTANSGPTGASSWLAIAGAHQLQAVVDDVNRFSELNENNNSISQSIFVASSSPPSDLQAPSVSITSPANGATFPSQKQISVTANASDNIGVKSVRFYLNGVLICTDPTAAYQCSMKLPKSRGSNVIEVQASDAAGNVGKQQITILTK